MFSSNKIKNLVNNPMLLNKYIKRRNGKNNQGITVVRHRGGGKKIKKININNNIYHKNLISIKIIKTYTNIYNRTSYIAYTKNLYKFHEKKIIKYSSIICQNDLKKSDILYNFVDYTNNIQINYNQIKTGNLLCIKNIPVGTLISNIELNRGKGSQLARAAGTYGQIIKKDSIKNYSYIKLKSGNTIKLNNYNIAQIGIVSNKKHHLTKKKKAGDNILFGIRPHVRGVAMNMVDHPHGSSGGKTSGGRCSVTPWGKLTKGKKTVKK